MKIFHLWVMLILMSTSNASAKNLLVLGDSLSAAYNMKPQQGWVALMANEIEKTHPDINVINASISGETTSGGLARLPALISRHQPDYIVLELAANDGLRGTPIKIIRQNITELINLSQQAETKVLLVGMRLPTNLGPRYTTKFFNIFTDLAEQFNTLRVPFLMQNVALEESLLQADRLHPNVKAQPIILKNVLPYINALLEK